MSTLTNLQHYVWQHYLKPWTSDEKLFCYRQADKKLFRSSTKRIAAETFFYKVEKLTDLDVKHIKLIIDRVSSPDIRNIHKGTLRLYQMPFQMRELLTPLLPKNKAKEFHQQIESVEKTLAEKFHTFVEQRMITILAFLVEGRCEFYGDQQAALDFINFLTNQFFRTPKLRNLASTFENPYPDLDLKRTWLIESQIYAVNVAAAIFSEYQSYKLEFLANSTKTPLITGDQPVFNLNTHIDENLRLYYPLSPSMAIIFSKEISGASGETKALSEEEVRFYNQCIYNASTDQIYGRDKDHLFDVGSSEKFPDVITVDH